MSHPERECPECDDCAGELHHWSEAFGACKHCGEPLRLADETQGEESFRVGDDLERRDPPDLYERIASIIGADPDGSEHELCDAVEAQMVELRRLQRLPVELLRLAQSAADCGDLDRCRAFLGRYLGQLPTVDRAAEEAGALDLDGPESGPYTHVFTVSVCIDCGSEILPGAGRCLHCEHSNDAEADLIEADPDPADLGDEITELSLAGLEQAEAWMTGDPDLRAELRTAEWAPTIDQIKAGNLSEIEGWIGDAEPDDTVEVPAAVLQALLRQIRPVEPAGAAK